MNLRHTTWVFFVLGVAALALGLQTYGRTVQTTTMRQSHHTAMRQVRAMEADLSNEITEKRLAVAAAAAQEPFREVLTEFRPARGAEANRTCDIIAAAMRPAVVYLMDAGGTVLASSNRHDPDSFLGKNYAFRSYFQEALHGGNSVHLALGVTSGTRGIYYGAPVTTAGDPAPPLGVLVVKRSIDPLDEKFSKLGQLGSILLVSPQDVVFSSTVPEWRFGTLWEKSPEEREGIRESRQFGAGPWPWIGLSRSEHDHIRGADGTNYVWHEAEVRALPGWKVLYLHDMDRTRALVVSPLVRGALLSVLPGVGIIVALSLGLFLMIQRYISRDEKNVAALQASLARVRTLEGFLPICMHCKKIRKEGGDPDAQGDWEQLEEYIGVRTETQFSHGICPECMTKHYPDDD